MNYTTHELQQGTPEWIAHRKTKLNASDAASMLGLSSYKKRSELLHELATGFTPDIDPATQARFNKGHEHEAMARRWAEELIGDDLYPATISADINSLPLGVSLDGINMSDTIIWEHKTLNQNIADSLARGVIPAQYEPQMEQGLLISGASRCLFMASNGSRETMVHQWYESKPAVRAALLAGWKQFKQDLADYVPAAAAVEVMAAPVESLPAVSVRMDGKIAVISNLDVFGAKLKAFVEKIDKNPSTDQAFADAEAACKTLQKAQDALEQAESAALAQTSSIEEMRRTVNDYATLARTTRLMLEKVVKNRKEQIRIEIQQKAQAAFAEHLSKLNKRLSKVQMPPIATDFAGAMKGKKTIAGVQSAVDDELARAKIAASETADHISANLAQLEAAGHAFLFNDLSSLVLKQPDDLANLIKGRIADHAAEEEKRREREREKIREEERQRAENEERARLRKEEQDRMAAEPKPESAPQKVVQQPAPTRTPMASANRQTQHSAPQKHYAHPSNEDIVSLVAEHYSVPHDVAIGWLNSFNMSVQEAA